MANKTRAVLLITFAVIAWLPSLMAQQKAQWLPGQSGLNAGVLPAPGFTYSNLTINYSSDSMKNSNGSSVPVSGTYNVWAVENIFYFVPKFNVLGGHFGLMAMLPVANGSLTVPQFGLNAGGYGLGDMFVQPAIVGWNFKRVDNYVAYGFVAPTGRYTSGATDNIGSGYWGHNITTGTTFYVTKNKLTSANLTTNWEIHGQNSGTKITPGQAFTVEWGLGKSFVLDKQFRKLLQLGVIGYNQWQVTANSGNVAALVPNSLTPFVPASLAPYYSVHAIGFQTTFMVPAKNVSLFFKFEPEYRAKAHAQGYTIAFGGAWTLRIPKPPQQP